MSRIFDILRYWLLAVSLVSAPLVHCQLGDKECGRRVGEGRVPQHP